MSANSTRPLDSPQFPVTERSGLNPFFSLHGQNFNNKNERDLMRSLHRECIGIHGVKIIYVPRILNKLDRLFGEDVLSSFEVKYEIAAWVENFDGYGPGGPDVLSKFGIQVRDELTLRIASLEFIQTTGMKEPREGDLVFMPIDRDLLEVKWVEDQVQFYPLGQQMTFQLRLESFEYSMEKVKTGSDMDLVSKKSLPSILDDIAPLEGDNKTLQDTSGPILDWSEKSPFGDY